MVIYYKIVFTELFLFECAGTCLQGALNTVVGTVNSVVQNEKILRAITVSKNVYHSN